jgi:hypothetical protein
MHPPTPLLASYSCTAAQQVTHIPHSGSAVLCSAEVPPDPADFAPLQAEYRQSAGSACHPNSTHRSGALLCQDAARPVR